MSAGSVMFTLCCCGRRQISAQRWSSNAFQFHVPESQNQLNRDSATSEAGNTGALPRSLAAAAEGEWAGGEDKDKTTSGQSIPSSRTTSERSSTPQHQNFEAETAETPTRSVERQTEEAESGNGGETSASVVTLNSGVLRISRSLKSDSSMSGLTRIDTRSAPAHFDDTQSASSIDDRKEANGETTGASQVTTGCGEVRTAKGSKEVERSLLLVEKTATPTPPSTPENLESASRTISPPQAAKGNDVVGNSSSTTAPASPLEDEEGCTTPPGTPEQDGQTTTFQSFEDGDREHLLPSAAAQLDRSLTSFSNGKDDASSPAAPQSGGSFSAGGTGEMTASREPRGANSDSKLNINTSLPDASTEGPSAEISGGSQNGKKKGLDGNGGTGNEGAKRSSSLEENKFPGSRRESLGIRGLLSNGFLSNNPTNDKVEKDSKRVQKAASNQSMELKKSPSGGKK